MVVTRRFGLSVIILLGAALVGTSFLTSREALSYPDLGRPLQFWEYSTSTVEPDSLGETLDELGGDGWEVISVVPSSSMFLRDLEDNETRLIAEKYQVTARRANGRRW